MGDRRWCLTGTPVQNKLDDVFALVKFLRVHPFDDKAVWSEYIGGPAKFGQALGVTRLQTLMKAITLRRTKESKDAHGNRILNLPPRHDELRYLKFDEKEKEVYDSYYTESKAEFTHLSKRGEVMKNYVGILQKILRLRQICDHYELVKGKDELPNPAEAMMDYDQIVTSISRDGITINSATSIFNLLLAAGTAQCVECAQDFASGGGNLLDGTELDMPSSKKSRRPMLGSKQNSRNPTRASSPAGARPVITKCQHLYCIECFRLSICPNWPRLRLGQTEEIHRACSICQADLEPIKDAVEVSPDGIITNDLVPKSRPPKKEKRQKGSALGGYNASTKVKALLGDLMEISKQNPHSANYEPSINDIQQTDQFGNPIEDLTKIVVFSQWTSMLDKWALWCHRRSYE
jgi:SNF2 family DNA or RNA helicase